VGAEAMLANLAGSYIPLPRTEGERQKTGDPRQSIKGRYGSFAGYCRRWDEVCKDLVKRRYLLPEDVDRLAAKRERIRPLFDKGE
jgi:hypothetical protein